MKKVILGISVLSVALLFIFILIIRGKTVTSVWPDSGCSRMRKDVIKEQSGILLAFDDYSPECWEAYFDMFDEYDVKVTFFVNLSEPTEFCAKAVERGHEIGFHTIGHVRLTEASEEEIFEQAIAPMEVFREQGYELTSFAYPYGTYTDKLNNELLQHYKVLRGAYKYELNIKENLKEGFVESKSIDNTNFQSDEDFFAEIDYMLDEAAREEGTVVSLYSHGIGEGEWCITPDRLAYIFEQAQVLELKFYTFKDLQKNYI